MSSELPKWLEIRFQCLWNEFQDRKFTYDEAVKILVEKNKDDWHQVPVYLSELRKLGWLITESDLDDSRKKLYRLVGKEEKIREAFSSVQSQLNRTDIDSILKKAADLIRTRVDYKFILILLFLKRISDKWAVEYEQAYKEVIEDGLSEEQARIEAKRALYHDFDLPEEYLWDNLRKNVSGLPENMSKALKIIAERNPELKDVVDSVDFIQFTSSSENSEILRQLVELFSEKRLYNVSPDILGDAYEWTLRYFAPTKAKEGEIYTPREVIKLLVEILNPKPEESVYDPACGSGGMLIQSYKHAENKYGKAEADKLFLYGQEANQRTVALAKMNMYIHGIRNFYIEFGDTFLYPKFKENNTIKKFDVIMANPPWNQDGYPEDVLKKGEFWQQRFSFGFTPAQSADWAWIQHMLSSAANNDGRAGVVIDNGCLFRGGKEQAIRQRVIERDLLECVILLPEKLFYNTGAPGAIMIFRINKLEDRKNKVLFINASNEYEQHPEVRKLNRLGDSHIEKIASIYGEFKEVKDISKIVSIEEIRKNNWNLNVSLYVAPEEDEENIDVVNEFEELKGIENEKQQVMTQIENYISELAKAYEE